MRIKDMIIGKEYKVVDSEDNSEYYATIKGTEIFSKGNW